jgi:hypothetical protein
MPLRTAIPRCPGRATWTFENMSFSASPPPHEGSTSDAVPAYLMGLFAKGSVS